MAKILGVKLSVTTLMKQKRINMKWVHCKNLSLKYLYVQICIGKLNVTSLQQHKLLWHCLEMKINQKILKSSEDSGRCPVHGCLPDQAEEISEGLVHSSDPCPVHGCLPEGGNRNVTNDSPSAAQVCVTKSENTDHMDGHNDCTMEHHSSEHSENTESAAKTVGEHDVSDSNGMNNNEEDGNSSGKLLLIFIYFGLNWK